jgi:hypothetical protein
MQCQVEEESSNVDLVFEQEFQAYYLQDEVLDSSKQLQSESLVPLRVQTDWVVYGRQGFSLPPWFRAAKQPASWLEMVAGGFQGFPGCRNYRQ